MLRPFSARRRGSRPRALLLAAFLMAAAGVIGFFAAALPARAASEAYTVRELPVDAEAKSAAEARNVALAKGQREAFGLMVARLVVAEDQARLPSLGDAEIADLIEGFEIGDERVSPTRYRASLTVTFREDLIKSMLRDLGVRFAESTGRPIVVIPVLIGTGGPILWSDDNVWLQAWSGRDVPGGLVPIVVPLGDSADIADLSAPQAVEGDASALAGFAARYGASEAVVVEARIMSAGNDKGGAVVALSVERAGANGPDRITEEMRGDKGQPLAEVLARATDRVAARLSEGWKVANVIRYDTPGTLRATVPLTGLRDWVEVRAALTGLSLVAEVEIIALARSGADIVLHYYGDQAQLESALDGRNLVLTPRPDGGFTLAPRQPVGSTVGSL